MRKVICFLADQVGRRPSEIMEWEPWEIFSMLEYYGEKFSKK
jgi:hypothetical protein